MGASYSPADLLFQAVRRGTVWKVSDRSSTLAIKMLPVWVCVVEVVVVNAILGLQSARGWGVARCFCLLLFHFDANYLSCIKRHMVSFNETGGNALCLSKKKLNMRWREYIVSQFAPLWMSIVYAMLHIVSSFSSILCMHVITLSVQNFLRSITCAL